MNYVQLNCEPIINGQIMSTWVDIIDISNNIATVNISNAESVTYKIDIVNNDVEGSIQQYFQQFC